MPTQIDQPASSGVKSSWASMSEPRMTAEATAGSAKSSTQARKKPKTAYEIASDGTSTASALPSRNSSRRIGVVSTGSSVPCSRSPTTA